MIDRHLILSTDFMSQVDECNILIIREVILASMAIDVQRLGGNCFFQILFKAFQVRGVIICIPNTNQIGMIELIRLYSIKQSLLIGALRRPSQLDTIVSGRLHFCTKLLNGSVDTPVRSHNFQ